MTQYLPYLPTYLAYLGTWNGKADLISVNIQHCPSVAYDYCCQWYTNTQARKETLVANGVLFFYLPWTQNCGAAGPFSTSAEIKAVVAKIDAVCACTILHKVRVTLPNDYAALTPKPVTDPVCEQDL